MTNAIVVNTLNGAVTEYDSFAFQSITPTHAGSATGLFELGGDLDIDQPIDATIQTGKPLWGTSLKKSLGVIFLALKGTGEGTVTVVGETTSNTYNVEVRSNGVSRAKPGRGIKESNLAFAYSNVDGAGFQLDRIDVEIDESVNRRAS